MMMRKIVKPALIALIVSGFAAGQAFTVFRLLTLEKAVRDQTPLGEAYPGESLAEVTGAANSARNAAEAAQQQSGSATVAAHEARDAAIQARDAATEAASAARRAEIEAIH